jgi:hypothetical protein
MPGIHTLLRALLVCVLHVGSAHSFWENVMRTLISAALAAVGLSGAAHAQLEVSGDLVSNCAQIENLRKAGNGTEALNAARLCLQGLEQQLTGEIGQFFPTNVAGWTRSSFDEGSAMGFTNITSEYEKGDNTATVSLTREAGGGAGGLGGLLGGLARAGLAQSGKQVRVGGLPASVQPDGTISVSLEDGSFLTFQSPQFDDADSALAGIGDLVNAFPVADINKTLQAR